MAKLTTYETPAGAVRLSAKGVQAFNALCRTGGDVTLAAAFAKLSTKQVGRIAKMPGIEAMMVQRGRQHLIKLVPKAAEKLGALMDSPSQKVQLDAAERVLSVSGITPPAKHPGVSVNVGVQVGYVVNWQPLPPDEPAQHPRRTAIDAHAETVSPEAHPGA